MFSVPPTLVLRVSVKATYIHIRPRLLCLHANSNNNNSIIDLFEVMPRRKEGSSSKTLANGKELLSSCFNTKPKEEKLMVNNKDNILFMSRKYRSDSCPLEI